MASPGVIYQTFQWYSPGGGFHWRELAARAKELAQAGFTAVWIPPAGKGASGGYSVGYDVYDLFDLGEFDQKGTVPTKYGTKDELRAAIRAAQDAGLQVYADVVFNHKGGADERETVWAQPVSWNDRNVTVGDWRPISAWTKFTFPGRAGRYSTMVWYGWCFDALAYNAATNDGSVLYRLKDRQFSTEVSHEHGNYEYLIADDLDMGVDFVAGELRYWGEWFLDQTGMDGFRLDACKHIRWSFFPDWLGHQRARSGRELFTVGEYWSGDVGELLDYLDETGRCLSLFDVPLHQRFSEASRVDGAYDLRTIFDGTLVAADPMHAVTFVENHDTQPCQSLESVVEPWFKPLAYALILLREGGYPCVFEADYRGATYHNCRPEPDVVMYSHRAAIDGMLDARRRYGWGDQHDYFDHPDTVGWVRTGNAAHPGAMAVLLTDGATPATKWMNVYRPGATFVDLLGHVPGRITANADGWAEFRCEWRSVSVWVEV